MGSFSARLLDGKSGLVLKVEAVERMEADEDALRALFQRHLPQTQVGLPPRTAIRLKRSSGVWRGVTENGP